MFTGIIEETGRIHSMNRNGRSFVIKIDCNKVISDNSTSIGDSIAVNGICLTVTDLYDKGFTADVMPETVNRSSLANLHPGSLVNLERAMTAGGRLGGHIVTGHIDTPGTLTSIRRDENAVRFKIRIPPEYISLVVEKGSVTLDGISLTVTDCNRQASTFGVSVIPHTLSETSLSQRRVGDLVNIETDIIGKYVKSFMEPEPKRDPLPDSDRDKKLLELLSI